MNEYMPVLPAVRTDRPSSESDTPAAPQLKKRSGSHGKSAFKQTTLMFGKKPKPTPSTRHGEIVDLSDV